MPSSARPTSVRYLIFGLTTLVAVLLYLDRFCLGFVAPYLKESLHLSDGQAYLLLDAFFYTYALGQIPCGWFSDRYGPRRMLALYLATWSALTALMGLAHSFAALLLFRLGCGLFEAGAYPACAGLIRRWAPAQQRGLASGIVSIGGRIGGAVAPMMTAYLMVSFVPLSTSSLFRPEYLLDSQGLARALRPGFGEGATPLAQELAPPLWQQLPEPAQQLLCQQTQPEPDLLTPAQAKTLTDALNHLLAQPDLAAGLSLEQYQSGLPAEALRLFAAGGTVPEAVERRNRLLLEVAFPDNLAKIYGSGWRPVLLVYGCLGVLLAAVFFWYFRDQPRLHGAVNEAEVRLIEGSNPAPAEAAGTEVSARELWRGILTSRSLWLCAFVQMGTNFGWVFLLNLFPTYLQRAHGVPPLERGLLSSLPFMVCLPMMIVGGWWTDRLTRYHGARLGRALPLALTRFAVAGAFLVCLVLDAPWPITLALCVVSLASDMGLPAIWAYALDVGDRNVGLVLGWGNMWGNLGAGVSTSVLGWLHHEYGWNAVFLCCAGVFVVIGLAALGIDATRPIVPARPAIRVLPKDSAMQTDPSEV
jgi:sugar phosphate permease